MAKIVFDRPGAAVETPAKPEPKPVMDLRWGAKHAPGPEIAECDNCGSTAMPQWGDSGLIYCPDCVPDALRYPAREHR